MDETIDNGVESAGEQRVIKKHKAPWLQAYQYKKGQSGNPSGRPKGSKSLKEYAKEMFLTMTDDEREDFLNGLDKKIIWEMAEGKAKQDVDLKGEVTTKIISVDE